MKNKTTYDVFIASSLADADAAKQVASGLEASGLSVFDPMTSISSGDDWGEAVKLAIAESSAVVLVATRPFSGLSSNIMAEIGAAWAWDKPVFALKAQPNSDMHKLGLPMRVHWVSSVEDLAIAVHKTLEPLSENDQEALKQAYHSVGVPSDTLVLQPSAVDRLQAEFRKRRRRRVSSQRLIREIIQLRKKGKLPRLVPS